MTEPETNPERKHIERKDGKWASTVTDSDLLDAVRKHSPAATREVGEEIDMTRAGAHKRLNQILESDQSRGLHKKQIGNSVAWFVSDQSDSDSDKPVREGVVND
jgi:hypothetical protein